MPYPSEHSCRLRDPGDFQEDSFRRMPREHEGKTYYAIIGRLKGEETMTDQAYRYPKETWSVSQARAHCKDHEGILFEPAEGEEEAADLVDHCCGQIEEEDLSPRRDLGRVLPVGRVLPGEHMGVKKKGSKEPIRVFEGTAKPHEPFWRWRDNPTPALPINQVDGEGENSTPEGGGEDGEEPEMELYGYISEYSWFEDDITPKMFRDDLMTHGKGGPITIRINSYGGDVIAASLMSTILRDYPGRKTVQIDAIAASAATVVAVAGDRIRMQDTAYFMIHDPLVMFFLAVLNIEELNRLTDSLKAVKEGIINAYEGKTGLGRTRISRLMTDETWMDAQRAVDLGFVDEIMGKKKKRSTDSSLGTAGNGLSELENQAAMVNCLRNYAKVPEAVLKAIQPEAAAFSEPQLTEVQQREAQDLRKRVNTILRKENP